MGLHQPLLTLSGQTKQCIYLNWVVVLKLNIVYFIFQLRLGKMAYYFYTMGRVATIMDQKSAFFF